MQYVLEGSVRRDAEKVRVSAQLVQLSDQTHLWARQYDRELSNLLGLQGEIAQEIGDEIQLTLGEDKSAPPASKAQTPKSYEAYDLYLKGRYFWSKRTPEGFEEAIKYFQQAIAKIPTMLAPMLGWPIAMPFCPATPCRFRLLRSCRKRALRRSRLCNWMKGSRKHTLLWP